MIAARRLGIPIVAVNHTIPECSLYGMRTSRAYPLALRAFRWYLAWLLEHATAICTPTMTAASLMNALGLSRRIEVISNGVDTTRFTPVEDRATARRIMGLPDKPVVLYTGRLDAEKDMETWLRAAATLPSEVNAHFVLGAKERTSRDSRISCTGWGWKAA